MANSLKLFQFIRKFQQTFGIGPSQPNQEQHSINPKNVTFLICSIQFIFTTGAFLIFEAKSMFEFGFAFLVSLTLISASVNYVLFVWRLQNTLEFIENCEKFIRKRVNSTVAYRETIGKIDLFNKYFWYFICSSFTICVFSPLPYTAVRYFIYDMEEKSFYLFCPSWYPFDWRAPSGYLCAFLGQTVGCVAAGVSFVQFLSLFFGSCWLFMFIADDITKDVTAFNTALQTPDGNRAELTKCFCDLAQTYSDAKQCVKKFNQIYEYPLLSFFTWNMIGLASVLVTLQFELWADADLFKVAIICYLLFSVTAYLLILCEPGTRVIKQFEIFEDEFGRCDWHLLPIELQRMFVIFLSEAQNGINITSYGGIACERDTAKRVLNKAFSYFMTFRRFRE